MFASFSTALSALAAESTAISVVGNNLANLNTTGFKSSTVSFHDLVTESLGGRPGRDPGGVRRGRTNHYAAIYPRCDSDHWRNNGRRDPGRRVLHSPGTQSNH